MNDEIKKALQELDELPEETGEEKKEKGNKFRTEEIKETEVEEEKEQEENAQRIKIPAGEDDIVIPLTDISEEVVPIRGAWLAFVPNFGVWLLIWIAMAVGLVILSIIFGLIGLAVGIFTFSAFHYYCFEKTGKKERAISEFQERLENVYESGPALVLKPFWNLPQDLRYPTGLLQLEFETSAGAVTAAGKYKDPGKHGKEEEYESTVLGIQPVLYYMWPVKKNDLLVAVKNAPAPNDIKALKDLFEEDILDVVRTIGGNRVWKDTMQNRLAFRDGATDLLRKRIDYVVNLTRLRPLALVIKHADISEELKKEITAKEIARYAGGAERIREREKRFGIAEGEAKIREVLNEIMANDKYKDTAKLVEAMITIRDAAAQGKATYIALPAELYGTLGTMLGGGQSPEKALGVSRKDLEQMLVRAVTSVVNQKFKQAQEEEKQ